MPFGVGETIGPYQILQQLGQGGMATVYKAYHPALDRYVAIKALHPAFMDDPNFLTRFQREARVVARLEHPNIVPVFDFAEHEGRPYLVMKYIEGETLKARLERGPLPETEILRVIEAVGSALSYAHQRSILHRDVKPSNVLVAVDGQIYLADFGLARIAQSGETTLTSDRMVGTPQYISPEQAMSRPDLDARTDIYSLGVMIYEMVVGRVPFSADTPFAVIHDHIYSPLPPPRTLNPNVSLAVERVLLKALAKDPSDRFCEAMEFVRAFRVAVSPAPESNPASAVPAQDLLPEPAQTITREPAAIPPTPAAATAASTSTLNSTSTSNSVIPVVAKNPAAEQSQSQATATRTGSQPGCVLGGIITAGVILVLMIGLFWIFTRGNRLEKSESATATALMAEVETHSAGEPPLKPPPSEKTPPPAKPIPNPQTTPQMATPASILNASRFLDDAIAAWRGGDWELMRASLRSMVSEAGQDRSFYEYAYQVIADQGAWRLGFELAFHPPQALPFDLDTEQPDQLHSILYHFALDPGFAEAVEKEKPGPLLSPARIRHAAYFGDVAAAQQQLGEFMDGLAIRTRFPEVLLLQAEISILSGDPGGESLLNAILLNKDLPEWVRAEAELLIEKGLPQIIKP